MEKINVKIMNTSGLPLPAYQTEGSAGFDFLAAIDEPVVLQPGKIAIVPTGVHVSLPTGHELQVRARSGLAAKHGIGLVNGVGTIDSDYRGEIKVIMVNHGAEEFVIQRGDRIAQGVVARYERVDWQLVEELDETERGHGGFGSTGA